jgi:hypothetical protein
VKRAVVSVLTVAMLTPVATAGPASATSSTLVVNEIDYDQPSTDDAEFLEIKNVSSGPVDLAGHAVQLVNGTGGGAALYQAIALPSLSLAAGAGGRPPGPNHSWGLSSSAVVR